MGRAAVNRRVRVAGETKAQWDEVVNVNLKGVWLCMQHQIPALLVNGAVFTVDGVARPACIDYLDQ